MTDTGGTGREGRRGRVATAFDIRIVIAALFALYGIVLTVMGLSATSDTDLDKAAGVNINLWAGLGMVVFAALMGAWTLLRPAVMTSQSPDQVETDEPE